MPIIFSYTEYDNETIGYRFEPGSYYIRVYSYNMSLSEYNLIIRK
jgi:hypothetical protein